MQNVLIIGGTGFIGQALAQSLCNLGYKVSILSRQNKNNTDYQHYTWRPDHEDIDTNALRAEIIINLTGEGIAAKRWTTDRKENLINSRVKPIQFLNKIFTTYDIKPKLFINASSIGYYGSRSDTILDESSEAGNGFLASCTKLWEQAAESMKSHCDRHIILRIGVVLDKNQGALPQMIASSKLGFLSHFGKGNMYVSWIHLHDLCNVFAHVIVGSTSQGVYNAVSPNACTNKILMQSLASNMNKIILPTPSIVLRLALGEMANVVLDSTRVMPKRLIEEGFKFEFEKIGDAVSGFFKNDN